MESDALRLGLPLINTNSILSPKELLDCDNIDAGCNGGWFQNTYQWIYTNNGIGYEEDYPYFPEQSQCTFIHSNNIMSFSPSLFTGFNTELDIANYVLNYGPVAAMIDATCFQYYISGIISSCTLDYNINHAVQIVGVNLIDNYWIVSLKIFDNIV